jgi:hypothetical protein
MTDAHHHRLGQYMAAGIDTGITKSETRELYNCTDIDRILEIIKKGLKNVGPHRM